jgi:putative iron-regulated protein
MRTFGALITIAAGLGAVTPAGVAAQPEGAPAVLATYADIAAAGYEDAWLTAGKLQAAIDAFLAAPGPDTHQAAKDAWLAARVPYQQTEAYRFGNAIVDDWEGRVNAWPLDEGLIDYVAAAFGTESDENIYYAANVVAHPKLASGGEEIDAATIDADLLRALHEIDAVEANVSTGYHAVEFLLWGQDLNGTGPGAGVRPWTDFAAADCTGGNCERRRAYLKAATDLLVADLEEMVGNWAPDGAARATLLDGSPQAGLTSMVVGLGSLSYGELAGERMRHYAGSLAFDRGGRLLAVSCPRGNLITFWDARTGDLIDHVEVIDGCGVAPVEAPGVFMVTSGRGDALSVDPSVANGRRSWPPGRPPRLGTIISRWRRARARKPVNGHQIMNRYERPDI